MIAYLYNYQRDPFTGYEVVDMIKDSSDSKKIVFMFISVPEYDIANHSAYGQKLLNEHPALSVNDDNTYAILMANFFKYSDTIDVPVSLHDTLRKNYPSKENLHKKLYYVPNGYVYTAISRHIQDLDFPNDTIIQSDIFIPRKGVLASEIYDFK